MPAFTLTLLPSGRQFTDDLLPDDQAVDGLTAYERQTLQFCSQWQRGHEHFVLHTSGSTGVPKPVYLTRQQMAASARMTGKALRLQPGDRALVNLNTQYIAGIMMLVRGMELGLQLTVKEPSAMPLAGFATHERFHFMSFVPLQLLAILETDARVAMLNAAKAILVGGAPVPKLLEDRLHAIEAPVYQTYGMTETVSHVALRRVNGPQKQEFYTLTEGVSLTADSRGCAVIDTGFPDLLPVVTNDVVEIISPSTFHWLGRLDNVINSGGIKVQAEKIESKVEEFFGFLNIKKRFFVLGLPHPHLGESVTLFIEGNPLPSQIHSNLIELLQSSLTKYELPKSFRYVSLFAETPSGKIDKPRTVSLSVS
jgi:O-succinylbenzoic acid--CoA ligase